MPLARIITRNPQDTVAVSDYLLSQGYSVETISPDEFRVTPAELELNLDKCRPGEVMQRAQALVEAHRTGAPIAVAAPSEAEPPQGPKVAIAYDIAGRPVKFSDQETAEGRGGAHSPGKALASVLQGARRGVGASMLRAWDSLGTRIRGFRQRQAGQRALAREAELAREREEMLQEEERARERVRQAIESQPLEAEQAELQRQRIAAEEAEERRRIAAEQAAAEARERARIEAERQAVLRAEQERVEAERQAALRLEQAQEAARHEAMIAAQRELEAQKIAPAPIAFPTAEQHPAEPANSVQPRRTVRRVQPARRPPIRISRVEIATAAAAALILALGFFGYATRRPTSPFSPGELMQNQSVKQEVPFGAATVMPAAVAPKPSPVAAAAARAAPSPRSTAKPSATRRSARRLRSASANDPVAEDEVVVRHLQTQPPKQQSTTSASKLKRYSEAN